MFELHNYQFKYFKKVYSHSGCINALSISQSGKYLASGSDDQKIVVHDLLDNVFCKEVCRLIGHRNNVFSLKFGMSDTEIFSCSLDGFAHVYDTVKCKIKYKTERSSHRCHKIDICSNSPNIFGVASTNGLFMYDKRVKKRIKMLATSQNLTSLSFNPFDSTLVISGNEGKLELFDRRNLSAPLLIYDTNIYKNRNHRLSISSCVFNQNGRYILVSPFYFLPLLYSKEHTSPTHIFYNENVKHVCTMKNYSFGGPSDSFILSGSDNKAVIYWKFPPDPENSFHDFFKEKHNIVKNESSNKNISFNGNINYIEKNSISDLKPYDSTKNINLKSPNLKNNSYTTNTKYRSYNLLDYTVNRNITSNINSFGYENIQYKEQPIFPKLKTYESTINYKDSIFSKYSFKNCNPAIFTDSNVLKGFRGNINTTIMHPLYPYIFCSGIENCFYVYSPFEFTNTNENEEDNENTIALFEMLNDREDVDLEEYSDRIGDMTRIMNMKILIIIIVLILVVLAIPAGIFGWKKIKKGGNSTGSDEESGGKSGGADGLLK
ncbi:hypothetical protein CWI38_0051p0020 [Hamiltosporidium tvaerminnensis]|uniref:Uncharacterized protein n=2 Tax=Hamiltosporidium TaxID=1176354 RepID=A0A4Q9M2Y8_9MICR|nr:hypothetical protein CWI38_0063p0030 [Hamiltosporidium tvaerminnensis]TBU20557.1 hypothetical protein CWI38_0051p0020 [Hamiltosporidium tvaerminnensis]